MSDGDIVTKGQFAALVGVHRSRVSQWLAEKKIHGDAIVGSGRHARIRVALAKHQLNQTLDIDQRIGANARARLDNGAAAPLPEAGQPHTLAPASPTIDDKLKKERLEQLELQNERAREERAARAGIYVRADAARREMGRVAAGLMTIFESALPEFAAAVAARSNLTSRDAVHLLRTAWRTIRERSSVQQSESAAALPALVIGEDAGGEGTASLPASDLTTSADDLGS